MSLEGPHEKYNIVDMDAHYVTELGELSKYIDDRDLWNLRFRDAGEAENSGVANFSFWPKTSVMRDSFHDREYGSFESTEDALDVMKDHSIDSSILISDKMLTFGLFNTNNKKQTVFANAYTDYMLDQIVDPEENIYMTVPVPYRNPSEAVELIDRVKDEKGVAGLCMACGHGEPPFGDRRYEPIYEIAQDAGLPICFHAGDAVGDDFYMEGFSNYLETHTLGFMWDIMAQITSIVVQGVPEKFPDLDFIFQEAGIFWIPGLMYRLDLNYMRQKTLAPLLEKRPSKYMKEFYYGTQPLDLAPNQKYFENIIEMIGGAERLMYASDLPHSDYDHPSVITNLSFLNDDEKAHILGATAQEVFDI
jgi:predicted TIM-barrel fold metal-dependent hydrolase